LDLTILKAFKLFGKILSKTCFFSRNCDFFGLKNFRPEFTSITKSKTEQDGRITFFWMVRKTNINSESCSESYYTVLNLYCIKLFISCNKLIEFEIKRKILRKRLLLSSRIFRAPSATAHTMSKIF